MAESGDMLDGVQEGGGGDDDGKATLRNGGRSVLKKTSGRRQRGKSEWDPLAFIYEANSTVYAQCSGSDSGNGKGEGSLEGGSQQKDRLGSWDGGNRWEDFSGWRELELMGGKVRKRWQKSSSYTLNQVRKQSHVIKSNTQSTKPELA
ncbi:uncharacterized protein PGTG_10842 [Puccinia graminis f. sp. tritici CRL 75-36-700-3]|uniref:Uncharacterized protein n=1 Tax=Puccinia graminis f. sp. tritici (strain CRL 75-36-700-3 / race SCCL) TaxID=418459 RepID=E3KK58_PUCGT|nr:uncharacterized protein PGTG_10842 [Puccinia graminis f. sp. tritici CRL 75-36-700-3]EFP84683.1 hypothetical protein PGTG_10842 [Puccinia graminis f. sp. tritici CRL 75-36-700-3]